MATKTRLLQQPTSKTQNWDRLIRQAISRAELIGDARAQGLKVALSQGKAAETLKRMGIIGENDLLREFPSRET